MKRKALAAFLLIVSHALASAAHDFSTSYSRFDVSGDRVRLSLTLNLLDLHRGPALDSDLDGNVTLEELEAGMEALWPALREHFQVGAPGPPVEAVVDGYDLTAPNIARIDIDYRFAGEVSDLKVVSRLDRLTQDNHRHLLQIGTDADARSAVLDAGSPGIDIEHAAGVPFWATMLDFAELGVEHIFTGYDHLAFLVGLLLATTTLLSLVKVVTSFTIAHSVTLAVATLGLVTVPSRLIESLIALSIAYVAIENFMGMTLVHRWKVTFLFGLIHGFGFSNVLREMDLSRGKLAISLFSFNIGVEIGQVVFVAVLFPLLIWVSRSRWSEEFNAAASVAIMCLGFYWFVQRALLG